MKSKTKTDVSADAQDSKLLKQRLAFWGVLVLFIIGAYFYIVQPW